MFTSILISPQAPTTNFDDSSQADNALAIEEGFEDRAGYAQLGGGLHVAATRLAAQIGRQRVRQVRPAGDGTERSRTDTGAGDEVRRGWLERFQADCNSWQCPADRSRPLF